MPALREALEGAGFKDVQTYVQSGNVVLGSRAKPETVRRKVEKVLGEQFGLDVAVVVRSRAELAAVARRNPLRKEATDPKRYQVTFLSAKLPAKVVRELEDTAADGERVVVSGREVYAWHPDDDRPLEALGQARGQEPRRGRDLAQLVDGRGAAGAARRVTASGGRAPAARPCPIRSGSCPGRRCPAASRLPPG